MESQKSASDSEAMINSWNGIGEHLIVGQTRIEAQLGRIEVDVSELRGQVNRSELANERRYNRIDAKLERLFAMRLDEERP